MKKIFTLILCLLFILPVTCLAKDSDPRVGIIRVDDDSLLNDNEISWIVEEKTASLFGADKYDYVSFGELEADFEAFLDKNNIQNNNQLSDDVLLKFAKEQNLAYLCFMNFNLEELQYDRVFFKSSYRAMLGVDLKYYNVADGSLLYASHLFADGSAKDQISACRKSAAKLMKRIDWHFSPDNF